jgi:hypothetical protein
MCLKDLLSLLRREGLAVSETKIRWAIVSGKVARPPLDGSLRFDYRDEHLCQLRQLFAMKGKEAAKC